MTIEEDYTRQSDHKEIEDEYQLTLDTGVEDDSLQESSSPSFLITSYGADYPVDTLVKRMKGEAFFIPKFQRKFVWSQRHASRFIESLLMGLPVPGIFLYKESESGKHLVVDGQQRLRSLQFFYTGTFKEKVFRLIGVNKKWEGKKYDDLDPSEQLKLDDSIVHATIFQQDEPKQSLKSLYFVFERINSGGIRLSPQEIRNCISESAVLDAVKELNTNASWRSIFGERLNSRLKDEELILRALAMFSRREKYSSPMRDFLNSFAADDENRMASSDIKEASEIFARAISLVDEALGKSAFRPQRALNAAVFEAVMVGLMERLRESVSEPQKESFILSYKSLLSSESFVKATSRATAQEEAVKTRQLASIKAFENI